MTTFDSNTWYQLNFGGGINATALLADSINTSGSAAVLQMTYNASLSTRYQWQLIKVNGSDTYALRSRYLGKAWFLDTFWQPLASLPGMDTRAYMQTYKYPDLAATSAQWTIQAAGDGGTGLYYLSTAVNTTSYHLDSSGQIVYLRDASAASNAAVERWALSAVGAINDATFSWTASSTSSSATATSTSSRASSAPASALASATASSAPTQPSQGSGPSTPTGAIVGGVIGGIAVLLLIFGLIFFYRRRRRSTSTRDSAYNAAPPYEHHTELDAARQNAFSERYGTAVKTKPGIYEKPSPQYETPQSTRNWGPMAELPAQER